jgi:hypothetical protein
MMEARQLAIYREVFMAATKAAKQRVARGRLPPAEKRRSLN